MGGGALKDTCPVGLHLPERVVAVIMVVHCLSAADASRNPDSQPILEAPDFILEIPDSKSLLELPMIDHTNNTGATLDGIPQTNFLYDPDTRALALYPQHKVWDGGSHAVANSVTPWVWNTLLIAASGTGAAPGSTGDLVLDQTLLQRMRLQDQVVVSLLLIAYIGTLIYSAAYAYQQSINSSPVTYYADPRYYTEATEANDLDGFLSAFNVPPKDVHLQITGFSPLPPLQDRFVDPAVDWLGSHYSIVFSFALDLSLWLIPDERDSAGAEVGSRAGVSAADLEHLADFLEHDENDLAAVDICKDVHWSDWEELATNIKHQIRQSGFNGIIQVCCTEHDEVMTIYKNKTWANFMHRRVTKVLCALSVIGWLIYQPYMWFRHRSLVITSRYRIDVAIGNYWPLIADKVGPDGFTSH